LQAALETGRMWLVTNKIWANSLKTARETTPRETHASPHTNAHVLT